MKQPYHLVLAVIALILWSCADFKQKQETLARRHCSVCHLFPDPSLLDKKTWMTGVFPEMAFRMGRDFSRLPTVNTSELKTIMMTLPHAPLVSEKEWKSIYDYYIQAAPDTLYSPQPLKSLPLHQFAVTTLSLPISGKTMLTMVKADPATHDIFIGTRQGKLYQFNSGLTLTDSFNIESPPSDISFHASGGDLLSCLGIMDPNDQPAGTIIRLPTIGNSFQTVIDSIKRPVDIQHADLNNDGQQDLIVSGFGNFTGGMYVYEKNGPQYTKHIIHSFPGTRKAIAHDFNGDGLQDILALITQGDEQIALFTNRGNFRFGYRIVLKFPPVYGSSYLDLNDFNNDGHSDILYSNGDNADYSTILKPYHGLRIFLNDGKNHFAESWFYPMHGASMARAADFDKDGDLDIAAIAFFPDFEESPEQSFIYFENNNGNFTANTTALARSSRWITMELADIDEDQNLDIIVAALALPKMAPKNLVREWKEKNVSLMILKNNAGKKK